MSTEGLSDITNIPQEISGQSNDFSGQLDGNMKQDGINTEKGTDTSGENKISWDDLPESPNENEAHNIEGNNRWDDIPDIGKKDFSGEKSDGDWDEDFWGKDEDTSEIQEKEPATLENNENDAIDTSEATSEAETPEKKGGSYGDVFKEGEGDQYEVHHMPADSASNLERNDGPAIKMEKEDHRQTASCGSSAEAREYREQQKELIKNGKFREALQMDIDDIHEKFGDKYDDAIAEMMEYVDQLEQEGKI